MIALYMIAGRMPGSAGSAMGYEGQMAGPVGVDAVDGVVGQ